MTNLLRGAELCHCAVEHVEVVEEIDSWNARGSFHAALGRPTRLTMHGEPFIEILAFRELDCKTQIP
jgi:hypothetical protein